MRITEHIGIIRNFESITITFVNPPESRFPNESLCDFIQLGIPFNRNLEILWGKLNLNEHTDEQDIALMKMKVSNLSKTTPFTFDNFYIGGFPFI